jgi:hypothetical protein
MNKGAIQHYKKKLIDMISSGQHSLPSERRKRKYSVKEPAEAAVNEWCHSNESSNLDTDSYRVVKVKDDATTGITEAHPFRVWRESNLETQYKSLESTVYVTFQQTYIDKTIGKEMFRLSLCKCVGNPGPQSCVDLHSSQLNHYIRAIHKATTSNTVVKSLLEKCNCAGHQKYREHDPGGENIEGPHRIFDDDPKEESIEEALGTFDEEGVCMKPMMWESLVSDSIRPDALRRATCCPSVE